MEQHPITPTDPKQDPIYHTDLPSAYHDICDFDSLNDVQIIGMQLKFAC